MEESQKNIFEIAMGAAFTGVLGIFAFFWKMSHRVSSTEKEVENLRESASRDYKQLRRDVDYILSKVDNADNRILSIVKNLPKGEK